MLTEPIAALATPHGLGALAIVRLSGAGVFAVAQRVLRPFHPHHTRTAQRARAFAADGVELDNVVYVAYRAPASYTGEDTVEITTHGGTLVPASVLAAVHAAGARPAAPGEFTRRAVLNGKLDLLQAEATADLVASTAPAQRRAAIAQLDRGLSERIGALRDQVLGLDALVAYDIDFPEEDSGPIPPDRVLQAVTDLTGALDALLATAADGERLRSGALCVIAGAPNVGKSSLFNALLARDRALVTEVAGTTRDAIEADVTCEGYPFRLVDTAGLHVSDDRIEQMGIEVSHKYLAAADLVLFCADAGQDMTHAERAFLGGIAVPVVVVRTKCDLMAGRRQDPTPDADAMPVSAVTGTGIPALRRRLARLAFGGLVTGDDGEVLLTRVRHRDAMRTARAEVAAFGQAFADGVEAAAAATHLRAAVTALEDIIGLVAPDDVLDRLFATFCVGK